MTQSPLVLSLFPGIGMLDAAACGVPIPMGRAVAKAVRRAIET